MSQSSLAKPLQSEVEASMDRIRGILSDLAGSGAGSERVTEAACIIAEELLRLSRLLATRDERKRTERLARLMDDPSGQLFSTLLTDRVPRLRKGRDVVTQARKVLAITGAPRSLGVWDRLQLRAMKWFGHLLPSVTGSAIRGRIQSEAKQFLIPGEEGSLGAAVARMRSSGVRVNVNRLGEEVLGHAEAERHMTAYLELLTTPEVDTISVKISSICAQLNPLSWDASMSRICAALERLYRVAMAEGKGAAKLIMLDMEAYRDLELTYRAFMEVLSRPEFTGLKAGIVLQAYIPDSHGVQDELITWAKQRRGDGGAPIQMRLVKGANLAVERVESSLMGWPVPIFESKQLVDASFKEMIGRAIQPDVLDAVRLGVASHNLFDVAYTLVLFHGRELKEGAHFEVLAGMAGPLSRCLMALGRDVLVYSPAVAETHLHAAVAYLVRRMDENTADENFLRHSFAMQPGDEAWEKQKAGFLASRSLQAELDVRPRRRSRTEAGGQSGRGPQETSESRPQGFCNEPDTDFVLPGNRLWIQTRLRQQHEQAPPYLPIYVGGEEVRRDPVDGFDPSRPGHVPYSMSLATEADVALALETGLAAQASWGARPAIERAQLLRGVAEALRGARLDLIAALVMDGGKAVVDADAEISEAIDFAEYYAATYLELDADPELELRPRGLTVVTPPWNFPLAIPLGGVFAALMAGNPVILKPAKETAYIGIRAAELCYRAGIPRDALQCLVAEDTVATPLITDDRVRIVVLTGGTETARLFKRLRPDLYLLAETGGKNATIISRFADFDVAVAALVQSAFAHAGQKCSATSLLIITKELADNRLFREQLVDAASSMVVGSAWDLDSRVTPLIHPPQGALLNGLTSLEAGEFWWLEPERSPDNPRLWSPGIRAGVKPGSYAHQTEFFGPVLTLLVAEDLEEAIEWANATPYGLTAGFHSLDEEEQRLFIERMDAGNLYVNRTTTGAIVRRQPFGGRKASNFGPGAKAGGPNYVSLFSGISQAKAPEKGATLPTPIEDALVAVGRHCPDHVERLRAAACSYVAAVRQRFSQAEDPSEVRGQDNLFRIQFRAPVLIVAFPEAELDRVVEAGLAALATGVPFEVVACDSAGLDRSVLREVFGEQAKEHGDWQGRLDSGRFVRVRAIGRVGSDDFDFASTRVGVVDDSQVLESGRIECLRYGLEQSVSIDFHRYGHLGTRESEWEDRKPNV